MRSKVRSHLSYANVVSTLCLFIVLGGTSYAVATGSIDSREIKNSTIRSKDVKNNSLKGADVTGLGTGDIRDSSLLAQDFKPGQLPAGAQGAPGVPGSALAYAYVDKDGNVDESRSKNIGDANVSQTTIGGAYCIRGLPIAFRNVQVTLGFPAVTGTGDNRAGVRASAGDTDFCSPAAQITVATGSGYDSTLDPQPFWILLN
jgi:hypothetical protein